MTELERKPDRAPIPAGWEYATAPESREIVTLRERYGHFVYAIPVDRRGRYTVVLHFAEFYYGPQLPGGGGAGQYPGG